MTSSNNGNNGFDENNFPKLLFFMKQIATVKEREDESKAEAVGFQESQEKEKGLSPNELPLNAENPPGHDGAHAAVEENKGPKP